MSDFSERIENISSKLRNLLKESEELKRLVEQRMMRAEDTDASQESEQEELEQEELEQEELEQEELEQEESEQEESEQEESEQEEEPVVTELVTRRPWCWLCCRRY
jgi:exosome complex component RRP41